MSACETCWAEASRKALYSGRLTADVYPEVLRKNDPWSPEKPCGGISVNGSEWVWCEVHMQPRGHFDLHPHTAAMVEG